MRKKEQLLVMAPDMFASKFGGSTENVETKQQTPKIYVLIHTLRPSL